MRLTCSAAILGGKLGIIGLCLAVSQTMMGGLAMADSPPAKPGAVAVGYEIFNREWMPNDPRGHGGDGLGPVYNDSSCVACHNSGGSGGAGPVSKNIDILNASSGFTIAIGQLQQVRTSTDTAPQASQQNRSAVGALVDALTDVHPGFRTSRTVVLHKFGIDPNYDAWRSQALRPSETQCNLNPVGTIAEVQMNLSDLKLNVRASKAVARDDAGDGRATARIQQIQAAVFASNPALRQAAVPVGTFLVSRSQRNPTPLFGLGLIDAIPDAAIEAMAKRQAKESPETQGRVSRLKDGRIGRLGWKGQTANVEDFVLNACAVELGLEVPGHHQAMTPQAPKYRRRAST